MTDLPSPFCGLVISTVRSAPAPSAWASRVRSERYCSAASDFGASAATSSGFRFAVKSTIASSTGATPKPLVAAAGAMTADAAGTVTDSAVTEAWAAGGSVEPDQPAGPHDGAFALGLLENVLDAAH